MSLGLETLALTVAEKVAVLILRELLGEKRALSACELLAKRLAFRAQGQARLDARRK